MNKRKLNYLLAGGLFIVVGVVGNYLRQLDLTVFLVLGVVFVGVGLTDKSSSRTWSPRIIAAAVIVAMLAFFALAYFSKA
jgi:uncharacterized membrane protein YbaN (DUF454 family)